MQFSRKNVLRLPQDLHDRIIMLRIMWEGTARAILDPSAVFLEIPGIPGAVLQAVHGAVAEQAVEICKTLVTGEIFTIFIFKKAIGIFHANIDILPLITNFVPLAQNLRVKHRTSSRKSLCSE